jgi:bifunctional DNA-binding transcriptional regulator/antitoxin component of YhaV-PrlF toxin-antitoxin module
MSPENKQALVIDEVSRQVRVMKTTLRVSRRGTFTVPAAMRRRLGLNHPNVVVVVEEREGGLFLRPSLSVRNLPKKQIAKWIMRDESEMAALRTIQRTATKEASSVRKRIRGEKIKAGADAVAWAERHAGDVRLRIKPRK